jgi:MYXO-CTERM domain-containing protein
MSFQLILTASGCGEAGDFDVEFRYNLCQWTTGDASDGSGGFGGTPSQAGFDAGNSVDFVEIPGSRTGRIHTILCTESNVGEPGIWRFQIRSGAVVCPDAGEPCETGLLGVCGEGLTNCVGSGTECVAAVEPSDERCDALDNDCDGETDEDEEICDHYQVCDRGICVDRCSEFGCPEGQECADRGVCVDAACIDVICDPGMVCQDGTCQGACEGVVCPHGESCRGGRCLDLCESLSCDDCTVCVEGVCESRCQFLDCLGDGVCLEDGRCVEPACVGVDCPPGTHCAGGSCVDDCVGAICPRGEICESGRCIPAPDDPDPRPDAGPDPDGGPDPWPDAGPDPDSGPDPWPDAGPDQDSDPGDGLDTMVSASCRCRSGGGASAPDPGLALLGLMVLGILLRLRRS